MSIARTGAVQKKARILLALGVMLMSVTPVFSNTAPAQAAVVTPTWADVQPVSDPKGGPITSPLDTPTSTETPTDTPVVSDTPTPASTATAIPSTNIRGHVTLTGRGNPPSPLWNVPVIFSVLAFGGDTTIDYNLVTDSSGYFTATVSEIGSYTWWLKQSQMLANAGTFTASGGTTPLEVGSLRPGDADNDNCVNVRDFNVIRASFGTSTGDPNWDARADFTGDGNINIADYNLFSRSYGLCGAQAIASTAPRTATRTATSTSTRTSTNTRTSTRTSTVVPTSTATNSATSTLTPVPTDTPTSTATNTPSNTATNTPVDTSTATSTATNTPASTSTNTPTNTATYTATNTSTNTSTPTDTPTSAVTSTSTPTDTPTPGIIVTDTPTITSVPSTATSTSTPTQPTLLAASAGPTNVPPASTIVLTYTVFSPSAQQVSLGAAIRVTGSGANFFSDPINDRTVSVVPGNNVVIRYFALPSTNNVSYDVTWGLWSSGFVTQYGLMEQDNVVHVSGATPTPVPVCDYSIVTSSGGVIVPGVDLVSRSHCTDCTVHIDMPFTYTLYDGQFSVIHAGNNGNVQFPTFTGISNGCLPEPAFNYVAVPYWEDLDTTDANDGIYTSVSGEQPNRILNIEWRAHNAITLAPVHFEVRIYEGQQKFEFIYDVVDQNGSNAAIGVQRDTTTYQQYQCHAGGITPGMMLTFNYACGLPTATATASWTSTATSTVTPTSTATNTPTNTATPTITPTGTSTNTATPAPPTATPSTPVLQNVALSPVQALGGSTIVMSYTVFSPNTQIVSLGGDMAPAGTGAYVNDPANDAQVQVVAGVNTVTRIFNLGSRTPGSYDVRWGLFGPNFGTQYGLQVRSNALTILNITATPSRTATSTDTPTPGPSMTPTNTLTPTPGSPTATPSTPVLQAVALGPVQANAGSTIVMTYTLFSPNTQIVSLGGDMAPAGTGAYVNDPANDAQVQVVGGQNIVTRNFYLGARSAGVYDVRWGLFGPNFGTQYGLQVRSNALTILAATVTPTGTATNTFTPSATPTGPTATATNTATGTPPTSTPTRTATPTQNVTNTPTPSVPTLSSVSFSPANVPQGGTVLMNFTIFSPAGGTYALGADILSTANTYSDPGNDRLVTVPAGTSVVSRNFYVRTDDATGTYDLAFGLWDQGFTNQYGSMRLVRVLVVGAATPTPSVGIPTYTPTIVPPPATPGVILDVTSPLTVTTSPGSNFTVSYRVRNTTTGNVSVKLRAVLAPSGLGGYGSITDTANESTVSVPPGYTTFTRPFAVAALTGAGSYDLTWSLVDSSTSAVLDTRTAQNLVWVNMTTTYTGRVSLAGQSLATSSITLQNGVVNRVVGNFTILNEATTAQGVILRMRITRSGTVQYVNDLPGDTLIRVPVGTTNVSRSFAIPRYLPSGSYDVVFELGDSDFNGGFDNNTLAGALQITNPAVMSNVGVPILMYHNINPTVPGGNWVKYGNFAAQMDYLVSHNYHTITGDDIYNYIYKGTPLPTLPVWLTFDDAYQNIYDYAYPIMNSRGLKASIFANTQWMGQMNSWDLCCEPQHLHMTWDMLQQMRNSGFAADSHTQHHIHFFEIPVPSQQSEVWGTQRDLVSFLGSPGTNFSYPYGQYPDTAKWAVAHSGFLDSVVVVGQKQYTNYADMYELTRIGISDSDTITTFANKLTAP